MADRPGVSWGREDNDDDVMVRYKWLESCARWGRGGYYWIRSRVNGSDFELRSGRDVIPRGMSWIREKVSSRQNNKHAAPGGGAEGENPRFMFFFFLSIPRSIRTHVVKDLDIRKGIFE